MTTGSTDHPPPGQIKLVDIASRRYVGPRAKQGPRKFEIDWKYGPRKFERDLKFEMESGIPNSKWALKVDRGTTGSTDPPPVTI